MTVVSRRTAKRSGVALVGVMMLCASLLAMLALLYSNTRTKRDSQSFQDATTRALMIANAVTQLAAYKFRVLPSEYYAIIELERQEKVTTDIEKRSRLQNEIKEAKDIWLKDFSPQTSDTAKAIKDEFDKHSKISDSSIEKHDFGIDSFDLISLENNGYSKDYIRIKAWGSYNGTRKDVEELIEVNLTH